MTALKLIKAPAESADLIKRVLAGISHSILAALVGFFFRNHLLTFGERLIAMIGRLVNQTAETEREG